LKSRVLTKDSRLKPGQAIEDCGSVIEGLIVFSIINRKATIINPEGIYLYNF
jgi:hypothetical protein